MKESLTIYLVEDNVDDEKLALRAISKASVPCEVVVARDGEEAIFKIRSVDFPALDLVLLDLKLPKLNGIEVLTALRAFERTRRVPVVCFTSSAEHADLVDCFDRGANSFVRKAIDYDGYMDRMAKLVEYWLTIHEPCEL